ncbi:DUF2508 family protein [Alicyclobacillaceae bacterium I2511]|nr:DUF2508 family protein [Alicyclobacillaceae bacterium I2511]
MTREEILLDNHPVAPAQSGPYLQHSPHSSTKMSPAPLGGFAGMDMQAFLAELKLSKRELDIARNQFEMVTEPLLVDHVVFRLGAAERHFNYLFQLARRMNIAINVLHSDWNEEE